MLRWVLATFSQMMGSVPLSTLVICGGSASSGRRAATRDRRSRTSLAALSRSRSSVNSTLICERSSRLEEFSRSTPSMPDISFSMICVMRDSTTSEEAPRYRVSTLTTGRSTSGNSRRDSRVMAPRPRMNSSSDITVAKTGRRTDRSEMSMGLLTHGSRRCGVGFVRARGAFVGELSLGGDLRGAHRHAVAHLLRSLDHHLFAGVEAGQDFNTAGPARTDAHFASLRLAIGHHEHVLALGFRCQRLLRDDQR